MALSDFFRISKIKKENEELKEKLSALEASVTPEMRDAMELKKTVEALKQQRENEQAAIGEVGEISELKSKIRELSLDAVKLENEVEKSRTDLQVTKELIAQNREKARSPLGKSQRDGGMMKCSILPPLSGQRG